MPESNWRSIESAPKDGTLVDLAGRRWTAATDSFIWARFPDASWREADDDASSGWRAYPGAGKTILENGWLVTHWMPRPELPSKPVE